MIQVTGNVDETFIVMTSGASPARPTLPQSHFQLEPMCQTGPSLLDAECGADTQSFQCFRVETDLLVLRKSWVTFQTCPCFLAHLSEADLCMSFQNSHCPLGKCHNRIRRLTRCKGLFWGQNEEAIMSCWAYHLLIKTWDEQTPN